MAHWSSMAGREKLKFNRWLFPSILLDASEMIGIMLSGKLKTLCEQKNTRK
jgi:hypothetical protein